MRYKWIILSRALVKSLRKFIRRLLRAAHQASFHQNEIVVINVKLDCQLLITIQASNPTLMPHLSNGGSKVQRKMFLGHFIPKHAKSRAGIEIQSFPLRSDHPKLTLYPVVKRGLFVRRFAVCVPTNLASKSYLGLKIYPVAISRGQAIMRVRWCRLSKSLSNKNPGGNLVTKKLSKAITSISTQK